MVILEYSSWWLYQICYVMANPSFI